MEIIIEKLNIENVNHKSIFNKDPNTINTNNYPKKETEKHLDYTTEIYRTSLRKWKNLINYPVILEYRFKKHEINIFLETHQICVLQQRLPKTHQEEYQNIINSY